MTLLAGINASTNYSSNVSKNIFSSRKQNNFRGEMNTSPELETDTVEVSSTDNLEKNNKNRILTDTKLAIFAITLISLAELLKIHYEHKKLLELCKNKIKLSKLPEHLEYSARPKEEAIKFAKETLGIKEIDETFSDLALNETIKAIVDVSNTNKGKVYVPSILKFAEMENKTLAGVNHNIKTDTFGTICINKKYYDNNFLTKELKDELKMWEEATTPKAETFHICVNEKFNNLKNKFIESSENLTLVEKRELFLILGDYCKKWNKLIKPKGFLNHFKKELDNAGIKYDYNSIFKLSEQKQLEEVIKLGLNYKEKTGKLLEITVQKENPYRVIYHEMGHLQDFAQNLSTLILKDTEWSKFKRIFTTLKKEFKFRKNDPLENVGSRWNRISSFNKNGKTGYEYFKADPKYYKQAFPDLYEHVMNPKIQRTAEEISEYAKEGVGEFVAEVYAEMVKGAKISDEVLALYKNYNGPLPFKYE